ncbi:ArnT family glycosyltransferase [Fontivita pretiosa]|uniref:ArnT family glycosyltransferase n=1 Tax=Fontivita pretiosa TaxID=2989684 RepID=UPI003D16FB27
MRTTIASVPRAGEPAAAPALAGLPIGSRLRAAAAALLPCAVALAMATLSFWLFTRNNDFPVSYHPDEHSKAEQIMLPWQPRNFNHPLLLLEVANLWRQTFDVPIQVRELVIAGRSCSALLASIGVFAVAMAGYVALGWVGLLVVGSAVALCPPLLVYAHYFKEDTALVCGMMLAILGAALSIHTRRWWTQLLSAGVLGVGCAAALSGKYVGAMTVVPGLITLLIAGFTRWWVSPARLVTFVVVMLTAIVAINFRAFRDWRRLELAQPADYAIREEFDHATSGHSGLRLPSPNLYCLRVATGETMLHLWLLGAAGAAAAVAWRPRKPSRWAIVLAAFLLAYTLVLSYNRIPFARYALPITICLYTALSMLAAAGIRRLQRHRPALGLATLIATLICIITLQANRCINFNTQFRDDSRQRLREWVARNLPHDARIVADGYTDLGGQGDPWRFPEQSRVRQRVMQLMFAADAAPTPADLANEGVQYVAVASYTYERFFVPGVEPMPGTQPERSFHQRADFYRKLFEQGKLLWQSVPSPSTNAYVNMELRLYQIDHLADPSRPRPPPRASPLRRLLRF